MKRYCVFLSITLLIFGLAGCGKGTQPSTKSETVGAATQSISSKQAYYDLSVRDEKRKRDIPVRVRFPESTSPAPVVLFSHGLGGSREGSSFLAEYWTSRGYVTLFLQHPGSDTSVWKDKPVGARMEAMRDAADLENFRLRVKDVPAVIDQIDVWSKSPGHLFYGRIDMKKIGMSGHSFGAVTTQAVSGQKLPFGGAGLTDTRIQAALILSPSSPRKGDAEQAFGSVRIPWMLMTGTKDVAAIGDADLTSRLAVFPALPTGGKYELVLFDAEHSAFSDHGNPKYRKAIQELSTIFWDAYLLNDEKARTWLNGNEPRSLLTSNDRWQRK